MRGGLFPALALILWMFGTAPSSAATDSFEPAFQAAMRQYYAALLSSARQDRDGTLRNLVQLHSRWQELLRISSGSAPAWARDAIGGQSVLAQVSAKIQMARQQTMGRNVAGAHSELEGVRLLLRDARVRHGVKTFDDAVTEYHDLMERVTSHLGGKNEFALTSDDLRTIEGEAKSTRTAWSQVEATAGSIQASKRWLELAARTRAALATLNDAASAHDSASAQNAAEALKGCYFDLLRILARG